MAKIDAVLNELSGGVYDIEIDDFGDIRTQDFFDTSILVSILSDKRANSSEVLDSSRRRGWIGNEVRDDGFEIGSKLWIFEQSRLTRTVMNSIEDVVRESLRWLVDDGFAVSIRSVRVEPLPPSSPVIGIRLTVQILRPQSVVVTRFFNLFTNTGVTSLLGQPPFENVVEPPFSPQLVSVDFDGVTEEMVSADAPEMGIENAWTCAVWWKPRAANYLPTATLTTNVFGLASELGSAANLMGINLRGADSPSRMQITIRDSAGTQIKNYRYDTVSTVDAWNFSLFTWDGTNLVFYHDGALEGPDELFVDIAGIGMIDTARQVKIANPSPGTDGLDGLVHSIGLWDVVLDNAAQGVLYNGGNGRTVDWKQNDGAYVAGPNVKHWWRPGFNSGDIGRDYGRATVLMDANELSVGIDASDVVTDSPGV